MALFKCKMCGGTLEIRENESVAECQYCGTMQTLPKLDDERRANMYDRANHFRRSNDFDKAMSIYEQILNEDNTDAEAHWSVVLCRFGIEYVEDPESHKRVPTVNRTQFTSIFADPDYKAALAYADGYQRSLYEEEARAIDDIQKGILAISAKEEPFDVFISFKETDVSGRRTKDAVLANELYHQLTQEGFKVFFAPITLEDKLGQEYEPYIFSALNSAKVMVVLGTKPEHFNAVWVKNEWSRYLTLIKNGAKKILIPAYKDMDPYDLPEEFSHLLAQDMSKLGFMQDLIRGIKKIIGEPSSKQTENRENIAYTRSSSVAPLLKRAFMFLEDSDWKSAEEYCEKILDQDPENGEAYLGKLMAELKVKKQSELANVDQPFDRMNNYQKAMRFGDAELQAELSDYIRGIKERNEHDRLESIYGKASMAMNGAVSERDFKDAAAIFETIQGYLDADIFKEECVQKAEVARKDAIYASAERQMGCKTKESFLLAIGEFQKIPGWKDADEKAKECQRRKEEIESRQKHRTKTAKRAAVIVCLLIAVAGIITAVCKMVIIPSMKYDKAMSAAENQDYALACSILKELGDYKDSRSKLRSMSLLAELNNAYVGDIVCFGAYEQDNNTANGEESIEWIVLANEEGRVLLISKYVLDSQPFHTERIEVTWETCSLRKWLNDTFYNEAFTPEEQKMIVQSTVKAEENPYIAPKVSAGNDTEDKLFLLSTSECKQYFISENRRFCKPTLFAAVQGSAEEYRTGYTSWLLRTTPGRYDNSVLYFGSRIGATCVDGFWLDGKYVDIKGGIRPAMWVSLEP